MSTWRQDASTLPLARLTAGRCGTTRHTNQTMDSGEWFAHCLGLGDKSSWRGRKVYLLTEMVDLDVTAEGFGFGRVSSPSVQLRQRARTRISRRQSEGDATCDSRLTASCPLCRSSQLSCAGWRIMALHEVSATPATLRRKRP